MNTKYPVSMKSGGMSYAAYVAQLERIDDYVLHPAKYWMPPFRIAGDLYYVGDQMVCSHLLDTGDGLILFDSGYHHNRHLLLHSIWTMGFRPDDIKYVIHSHAHHDHFGCGLDLQELVGAKLCMSRVDAEIMETRPEMAMTGDSADDYQLLPKHDVLLEDGQVLTLGNASILCRLAPGHTQGTMAFFFNVEEGGKTYRVGYLGGLGFNTLYKAYYEPLGLPDMQQAIRSTVQKFRKEQVDICLGNHPYQNCTVERRADMLREPGTNPFIDPTAWTVMLDAADECLQEYEQYGF